MKCRTAVALGAALGCFMASGCGGRPTGPTDPIVIAIANSPVILDPRIGTDEYSQKAHQLLFSSLFKIAPDLRVIPELAESVLRPDDVTYVIGIRRGVRFHNGRELTAADVAYTFASFLDPKFGGRSGAYRAIVRSVTALEPYTVRFTLKQPSSSFLVNLVMGIVQDGSGQANVRSPIGSGPFKLAEFVPDDRLVLAPFLGLLGWRAKERRHRDEGRARRHDARSRAAERQRRSRRQRPVPGYRLAARRRGPAEKSDR